ncbi:MAG: hypothetical protein ACTJLL_03900 [Anaplasma sp.]
MSSSFKVTGRELSKYMGDRDTSRFVRYGTAFTASISLICMVGLATRMGFLAEKGMESSQVVRGPHFVAFMVLLALFIVSVVAVMYLSKSREEELSKRNGLYADGMTHYVSAGRREGADEYDRDEVVALPVSFAAGGRVNPLSNPVAMTSVVLLSILAGIGGAIGPGAVSLDVIGGGFASATALQKTWAIFFVITVAFLFAASMGLFQSSGNRLMSVSSGGVENAELVAAALAATAPATAFDDVVSVHVHDQGYTGPGVSPFGLAGGRGGVTVAA